MAQVPYCNASDVLNRVSTDDAVEIFNGRLFHDTASPAAFVVGGVITGGTSTATGTIDRVEADHLDYTPTTGIFVALEVITQTTPVTTATVSEVETETEPNRAWVDQTILDCSSKIDGVLAARGYELPIPLTSPQSIAMLRKICIDGASCETWYAHVKSKVKEEYAAPKQWCKSFSDNLLWIRKAIQDLPDYAITKGRNKFKFGVA